MPLVIIAAIAVAIYAARDPWTMYSDQKQKVNAMRKELNHLKDAEIKHTETTDARANPVDLEEQARRDGWRPPGEIPLK